MLRSYADNAEGDFLSFSTQMRTLHSKAIYDLSCSNHSQTKSRNTYGRFFEKFLATYEHMEAAFRGGFSLTAWDEVWNFSH
jgi:hypothetical protein